MPRVPLLGRLALHEYLALIGSFILIGLEGFVRVITLALPGPVIHLFYRSSRRLFNYLSSPQSRRSRNKKKAIVTSIAECGDFVELCELFGYYAEEHIVQTGDGYLLGLHRLGWRKGEEDKRVNSGEGSVQKKVVYLHHGLMMNSEVWVCLTEKERCLPFLLVDRGYDVWFGNNRGNKYSKKSVNYPPTEDRFWSFSIDQFAFFDVPNSIDYILNTTGQPSLSYIGFSQGTAQAFATLSIHPTLNDKVDVFIALAPAMSPPGAGGLAETFIKTSPEVLFLAFGRHSVLSSATMWQALLYPPIFLRLIDMSLSFLFNWQSRNISAHQKLAAYPHLYSFTSTKSVVHWFQIIRAGTFQMYDDEVQAPFSFTNGGKYYKVAKFPTRNIKTPIMLVYGGSDSLVDINVMLKELPRHTIVKEIRHYEHLDFLWATDVDTLVFPHVFDALSKYASPCAKKSLDGTPKTFRPSSAETKTSNFSEDETPPSGGKARKISENVPPTQRLGPSIGTHAADFASNRPSTPTRPISARFSSPVQNPQQSPTTSINASHHTNQSFKSSNSRPEGWWSSDEVAGTGHSSPEDARTPSLEGGERLHEEDRLRKGPSRAIFGGRHSGPDARSRVRNTSLDAGRSTGGVASRDTDAVDAWGGVDGIDGRRKKKGRRKEGDRVGGMD